MWRLIHVVHQSFVTTTPQPTGKGEDYDFSVAVPTTGEILEVKTMFFDLLSAIANLLGVRILISKLRQNSVIFPAQWGQSKSYCTHFSTTIAHPSQGMCVCGGGVQMTDAQGTNERFYNQARNMFGQHFLIFFQQTATYSRFCLLVDGLCLFLVIACRF